MKALSARSALFVALGLLVSGSVANAYPHFGGRVAIRPGYVYRPYFYDPFFGPYPYGYNVYMYPGRPQTELRVQVKPKQAQVYVDGFYAGVADNFDGAFQRLHTTPGGHVVTLRLDGYRTVTENVYVSPGTTYDLHLKMAPLGPGETSAPVPPPPP